MTDNSFATFLDSATTTIPEQHNLKKVLFTLGGLLVVLLIAIAGFAYITGTAVGLKTNDVTSTFNSSEKATLSTTGNRAVIDVSYLASNFQPNSISSELKRVIAESGVSNYAFNMSAGGSTLNYSSHNTDVTPLTAQLENISSLLKEANSYHVTVDISADNQIVMTDTIANVTDLSEVYASRLAVVKQYINDSKYNYTYHLESSDDPGIVFTINHLTQSTAPYSLGAADILNTVDTQLGYGNAKKIEFVESKVYVTTVDGQYGRYYTSKLKEAIKADKGFTLNGEPAVFYVKSDNESKFSKLA